MPRDRVGWNCAASLSKRHTRHPARKTWPERWSHKYATRSKHGTWRSIASAPRVRGSGSERVGGCWGARVLGLEGARVRGCEGGRVGGCEGARLRERKGARVRGCEGARVRGLEDGRVGGCESVGVRGCDGAEKGMTHAIQGRSPPVLSSRHEHTHATRYRGASPRQHRIIVACRCREATGSYRPHY